MDMIHSQYDKALSMLICSSRHWLLVDILKTTHFIGQEGLKGLADRLRSTAQRSIPFLLEFPFSN